MSEFEQLYREVILDHYKTPRNHGLLEPNDAVAEGQNPLCGDEVTVSVRFGPDDVIESVGFEGRGCAISQAATSMLTEIVVGPNRPGCGLDAEGRAARGDRHPAHARAPQVRAARARSAQGCPQQVQGHAAPEEWGTSSGEIFVG